MFAEFIVHLPAATEFGVSCKKELSNAQENTTPLISKTAFSCPHCGAYTTQTWYQLVADSYSEEHRTPTIPTVEMAEEFRIAKDIPKETKDGLLKWGAKMLSGKPFFESKNNSLYGRPIVQNCNLSKCYNCKEITIWVYDKIVCPKKKEANKKGSGL